jgi:hypothetical protein
MEIVWFLVMAEGLYSLDKSIYVLVASQDNIRIIFYGGILNNRQGWLCV